jgi:hypothetical protein
MGNVSEAMLTADLSTEERRTWAKKLAQWQNEVDDYGVDEALTSDGGSGAGMGLSATCAGLAG